ncbi:MAG: DinB family protein [Bryobacterales bacterium]|nr:DinB family protein [Bryobacterales bacterium]
MTPEQASALIAMTCQEAAIENVTTRKVLAAVPDDKGDYTPAEKSMTALDLAWHIASAEVWFFTSIADGAFAQGGGGRPDTIKTPADVVAWYDANYGPALDRVKNMSAEAAAKIVDFYGIIQMPAITFMQFNVKHTCHHRGQLSVYLRPMGAKVPSIYGGSADEPFQASASA